MNRLQKVPDFSIIKYVSEQIPTVKDQGYKKHTGITQQRSAGGIKSNSSLDAVVCYVNNFRKGTARETTEIE